MVIFVGLGEIKKIIGNDYEVTVMVPAGKYWKWPSKEDRIFYERAHLMKKTLDYRVPTTPCTSRLKTKKTKNSFNLSRKYCMDKK